jgi:fructose-bisphosphate aldolase class 1
MMDERMKKVLERTKETLTRHLEDLNDQVDVNNGRIKDHMVLDGIKDSLKSVRCCLELVAMATK